MIEIGRVCVKTAGREAGKKCVVVDVLDKNYVLIDGNVRRKKCNISHLEPLEGKIEIKKKAAHAEVVEAFKKLGIGVIEKKTKAKTERPRKTKGMAKKKIEEKKGRKSKKQKKEAKK